jgi:hypothetical protein
MGFASLYSSYALPQRALTRTAATASLGCRVAGCMNSHSKYVVARSHFG